MFFLQGLGGREGLCSIEEKRYLLRLCHFHRTRHSSSTSWLAAPHLYILSKQSLPLQVSRSLYILVSLLIVFMAAWFMSREGFMRRVTNWLNKSINLFFWVSQKSYRGSGKLETDQLTLQPLLFRFDSLPAMACDEFSLVFAILTLVLDKPFIRSLVCALLNMGLTVHHPGLRGIYQFLLVYLLSIFGIPKHQGSRSRLSSRILVYPLQHSWVHLPDEGTLEN